MTVKEAKEWLSTFPDGCPDKNIFWIVMDVVKDGYIFNDGIKYSFDDQHHYEKTNREVINPMKNVLAELLEHIKTTSKEELEREFEEIKEWSNVGPTVEEFMDFCNKVNEKPKYPTSYEECYDEDNTELHFIYVDKDERDLYESFIQLIRCRNAYWKIAGEELELGKPWKPDWCDGMQEKHAIYPNITDYVLGGKFKHFFIIIFIIYHKKFAD